MFKNIVPIPKIVTDCGITAEFIRKDNVAKRLLYTNDITCNISVLDNEIYEHWKLWLEEDGVRVWKEIKIKHKILGGGLASIL